MGTEIITGDDIRFFAQQPDTKVGIMLGQMTTLLENINDLQNDTDDKVAMLERQGWFTRMVNTVLGKNRATKQEIQRNNDKVVAYISQSVAQLYQMNMVNENIVCSLGNRMNEVYMQVTNLYQEQLNMKEQISNIMAVQQQTLETMGAFVNKLNEKIESVDNFHMLISEIQNGMYNDASALYNLCSILSQLDKRQMDDSRKMNLLRDTMERSNIITQEGRTVLQYLQDIVALPIEKVGLIYLELCNFRHNFPANLFADMIEGYHFLTDMERITKKKGTVIQRLIDTYELDADAAFSIADIADNFIESKQACLMTINNIKISESGANLNGEVKEECCEKTSSESNSDFNEEEIIEHYNQLEEDNQLEEAYRYIKPFAERGIAAAHYLLGNCYYYEIGVPQDYIKAVEWYQKAAEKDYAEAFYKLGEIYYKGEGVPQDYTKAVEWYQKAAEKDYDEAFTALGDCYFYGNGVSQDYNAAESAYKRAAERSRGYYSGEYSRKQFLKIVDMRYNHQI